MILQKGDLCKHFKGETFEDKNIYEIIEVGVVYSGEASEHTINDLVIYRNIFENKVFAREMKDLTCELSIERQQQYGQKHRVDKLNQEEINKVKERLKNIK